MPKTFQIKRRVQFSETDMAGVLHFANYYRFMEEVEHAFWRSRGQSVMVRDGEQYIGWPRVFSQCEYLAPARFEDELDVTLTVADVSKKSVTYEVAFHCNGKAVALGKTRAVCCMVGLDGFAPIAIPSDLRKILESD